MSDVHAGKDPSRKELLRLKKGIRDAYSYAENESYKNIDAMFFVGDFTDRGEEAEMFDFKSVLDECVKKETDATISLASHEYIAGEEIARERFRRVFKMNENAHKVIKGFHFISVSTTKGCRFLEDEIKFSQDALSRAADENPYRPIFFFQHPHISGTVYGSINWGEDDLYPVLMNYPQVIDFSGHSHAPINDPRSVHQKYFTSFGTGSLSYFELDEFDKIYGTVPPDADLCAQFLIVEADSENRVRVLPFDILSGKFFPYIWNIDKPYDPSSFIYTDRRYKTKIKPRFKENAVANVKISDDSMTVEFDRAEIDEDRVNDYIITIKNTDGIIINQAAIWSGYYLYDMPETLKLDLKKPKKGDYVLNIKARGFWNNESENSLSLKFSV